MPVTIGALRESAPQRNARQCRARRSPRSSPQDGARVLIERGAGERARFPDSLYKSVAVGRTRPPRCSARADVLLTVQPLTRRRRSGS